MKVGVISDGKYGDKTYQNVRRRFEAEWILLDFPESSLLDEVEVKLPPSDLYVSYLRHPDVVLGVLEEGVPTILGISFGHGFLNQARRINASVLAPPTMCSLEGNTGIGVFDEFSKFYGKPKFDLEVRGGKIARLELLRESPCGSTREAVEGVLGKPASEETVRYFGLRVEHFCRAPAFGKTCDREMAGMIQARELAEALIRTGVAPKEKLVNLIEEINERYARRRRTIFLLR